MKKEHKQLLIGGAILIGGYFLYKEMQKRNAAPASSEEESNFFGRKVATRSAGTSCRCYDSFGNVHTVRPCPNGCPARSDLNTIK